MCIRDREKYVTAQQYKQESWAVELDLSKDKFPVSKGQFIACLLYTSDAADERSSVDLGGRRIIKKKNNVDNGEVG